MEDGCATVTQEGNTSVVVTTAHRRPVSVSFSLLLALSLFSISLSLSLVALGITL